MSFSVVSSQGRLRSGPWQHRSYWESPTSSATSFGPPLSQPPPTPEALDEITPLHGDRDGRWYVVYRGITPGVYQSSLECSLNTRGLSCATYESYASKEDAIAAFNREVARGRVNKLFHKYSS
ncbi:hypothetical protein C8R47DRAFT_1215662 [Mycena vitilis]|nr:hypothetical protein C8R47DRAFT_1215662 [Mycena vitilis]